MQKDLRSLITTETPMSGQKRIMVSVCDDIATIRFAIYEEGLGWCVQKTIELDEYLLDPLVESLAEARGKIVRLDDSILSDEYLNI